MLDTGWRGRFVSELPGLVLLGAIVIANAVLLWPETRFYRLPPNDVAFHLAATERLSQAIAQGEPLLDPWVSEWSLGYPVWSTYQPLPHLAAALILRATSGFSSHDVSFAIYYYILLSLLPVSIYVGARWLGLRPTGAALAAFLALLPAAGTTELAIYGLGYGATLWRGSGLYTQLFALHLLVLSLGLIARSLDRGTHRSLAALVLALTALSHIVFGYVVFVSAALLALVGPVGERGRRLARLGSVVLGSLFLLAWFVVPALLTLGEANHSRWELPYKWNSHGAPYLLTELLSGRFFDAGRHPVMSLVLVVGLIGAALEVRRDALARRLLGLTGLWLVLFWGRATWGHLLLLLGVPTSLHLHRLQAAFELSAVLAAAYGVSELMHRLSAAGSLSDLGRTDLGVRRRLGAVVAGIVVWASLLPAASERVAFVRQEIPWGERTFAAYAENGPDLDAALVDIREILRERPGRVTAGKSNGWGDQFRLGDTQLWRVLAREHLDSVSFLYHSMSLTSEVMVVRDEKDRAHDVAFGVRAVLAPAELDPAPHWRRRGLHGRFAVYEASPEGYFGLVDVGARYTGKLDTQYDVNDKWLRSSQLRRGIVAVLAEQDAPDQMPTFGRWQPMPEPAPALLTHRGSITSEEKVGELYRARVSLQRACMAFVKITYHPGLVARVDGQPATLVRVTPGFAAVAVPAGDHVVEVEYAPGPLRGILLLLGVLGFAGWAAAARSIPLRRLEVRVAERLRSWNTRLSTPRVVTSAILLAFALVALHPLFQGRLVHGHDASEYLPRLAEMRLALADRQLPPLWAPDLGNGHGQPLFQFAPPLLYLAAMPFHLVGRGLADSLQLALAVLHLAGAAAIYRIGRLRGFERRSSAAGAVLWLFVPYLALDLFVRAAFAEAAAVACAPVALLALLRALSRPTLARVAIAGAALSLVILSHNAAALLLVPAFVLVVPAVAAEGPPAARRRTLLAGAGAIAAALLLSAFFWLPAMLENDLVKTHLLRQDFLSWRLHVVTAAQLLWSPWGYGLSVEGPGDGMSFTLGLAHLALAIAGLTLAIRPFWSRRSSRRRDGSPPPVLPVAFACSAVAGALLTTAVTAPLWTRLEMLQFLAYPWRALLLPALFMPLLALPALQALDQRRGLLLAVLCVVVLLNAGHTEPKGYMKYDEEFYAPDSIARNGVNTTTREEYEPRWVEHRPPFEPTRLRGLDTPVEVREIERRSNRERYSIEAPAPTGIETALFYYPGWALRVDGQATTVTPVPGRGTMRFDLPAGHHDVVLELRSTPLRRAAALTSLAVALLAIGCGSVEAGGNWRREPKKTTPTDRSAGVA